METKDRGCFKVAIVIVHQVDCWFINQDNYNGVLAFIEENPIQQYKLLEPSWQHICSSGSWYCCRYDVIITPGFWFAGISHCLNPDKVCSYRLRTNWSRWPNYLVIFTQWLLKSTRWIFAGVAAALETKTNKVAVVNGIAFPSNVNYQFGFEAGVNYANKHLGTEAEIVELPSYAGTDVTNANVGGNYVGDFADEATGKVVGNALIDEGVDILFVAAGGSGNGVFTAAKEAEADIKVIGCDVDQFDDGVYGGVILSLLLL